jgi:peptidoglycan/xylan/chitin deacetylase (PgdA/CDA1 family)
MTPTAIAPAATATPTDVPPTAPPTATTQPTATPEPTATPRPQPTPDGVVRTLKVPILMYHYISAPPVDANAIRRDLSVSPELFAQHLDYMREAGYTTISMDELVLALTVGTPLPERPIVLTFDDGYRDAYEHAYPLLQERGYTGTVFLVTSFIDQQNPNYVTWEQVAEMSAGGMSMESHGYTHDEMEGRDREYLIWQMLGSKEAIEARTGETVRFFCYPSGYYDEHAMQVLQELGYWAATTIVFGQEHTSDSLFDLHRVRIHGDYSVERVAALLEALQAP